MTRYGSWRRHRLLAVIAMACSLCSACLAADGGQAVSLYKQGRYAEARPLLEALDAEGRAGGTLLYRLAFCQRSTGDATTAEATEQRAQAALEEELASTRDVEVPFYLVNSYQNGGRQADAQRVAAESTARFDKGGFSKPATGHGMFQLGKLYADHGAEQQAAEWYARAVEALTGAGDHGSYVRRASRYLADRAWRLKDAEGAARYYTHLIDAGEGDAGDFERLAVARMRVRQFAEAAQIWKQIPQRFGPLNTDRANYFGRLSEMASQLDNLPGTAADGREWGALSKVELEDLMKAEAAAVRQIMADAKADEQWSLDKRAAQQPLLAEHKAVLVGAGIEYGLRGHSVREAAFFGGFAPLILKDSAWRLPRVLDAEGKVVRRKPRKKRSKPATDD